jgi:RteC protein
MKEIEKIWLDLQSELSALDKEKITIKRLELSRMAAREAIERLEEFFVLRNGFGDDPAALGNFNRNLAPPFYAGFIFFSKASAFEGVKMDEDPREFEKLYEPEFAGIRRFFKKYPEFRRYYLTGGTGYDARYFQDDIHNSIHFDDLIVGISPIVNNGCLLVAYMQAFEEYESYLTTSLRELEKEPLIFRDLQWTGAPTDLAQLAISLEGYVNKGNKPATIKEITQAFSSLFHVDLANSSVLDNKRRNTLNEPNFLEVLAKKSNQRKNKLTNNQDSRTRRG